MHACIHVYNIVFIEHVRTYVYMYIVYNIYRWSICCTFVCKSVEKAEPSWGQVLQSSTSLSKRSEFRARSSLTPTAEWT